METRHVTRKQIIEELQADVNRAECALDRAEKKGRGIKAARAEYSLCVDTMAKVGAAAKNPAVRSYGAFIVFTD